ncbi:unnamed protein product [Parascedosporium putredinis]|uniref:DDHD domain-containing protein n=1 Tax=Parascedosporium putredinis TaxID=1442378 RepID=A0A9P1MAZ8_9PEZI|nr:unnamed protein product [Parascedosporium putredinis]CAI7995313.1 unnamed protein product [Parascedosporium putredinis]
MAHLSDKKPEKSYLSSAVDSINPWASTRGSNTSTPKPPPTPPPPATAPPPQASTDHSTNPLYGISRRNYPRTAPSQGPLVPKRKPSFLTTRRTKPNGKETTKAQAAPKKFVAFQRSDSRAIEEAYQGLLEEQENGSDGLSDLGRQLVIPSDPKLSRDEKGPRTAGDSASTHVPVNEDFLFDVDVLQRELAPVYWLGPVYEVRRGTWFYQEGSTLRPCDENLAAQLEEGYLKTKPWLVPAVPVTAPPELGEAPEARDPQVKDAVSKGYAFTELPTSGAKTSAPVPTPQLPSYRLFGSYMNSVATFQDENTAWLSSDGILSWVTSTVYQRFAGGGYMSGVKLVRGYSEPGKAKDGPKRPSTPTDKGTLEPMDEKQQKALKRKSAPPSTRAPNGDRLEEEIRLRQEQEIRDDYNTEYEDTQGRDIEHLILVTHGIGQLLSLRLESMNFIHDVNVMRKAMKSVYTSSADLKSLNRESEEKMDFPKQRDTRQEKDIGDTNSDDDMYPSLEDITIEGVAFARSIVSDLALDILLYQSGYREQIMTIVLQEANRIYNLFKQRNPDFRGKPERDPSDLSFDFDTEDFYCLGSPIGLFQMLKGRTVAARGPSNARASQSPLDPDAIENPFSAHENMPISSVTGLPFSVSSPRLSQLFNVFHPSDPISYRVEPLIAPAMSTLKPQILPYTKKGIFGSVAQQGLSGISAKVGQSVSGLWTSLSAGVTSSILNRSLGLSSEEVSRLSDESSAQQDGKASQGTSTDAASSLISDTSILGKRTDQRKLELADPSMTAGRTSTSGNDITLIDYDLETLYSKFEKARAAADGPLAREGLDKKARKIQLDEAKIRALNRNGRVDYSIQESVLDYNPINTIASHMSYWGDEDVNHFVLSQLLSSKARNDSR